ncbi:MAG: polysaccharide deacetylase family protein [Gallionellaceae bacterium]|nr:polysaccharide deacetylase family protein [Gallionellaceae bacterium]
MIKIRLLTYHKTSDSSVDSDVHVLAQNEFEMQVNLLLNSRVPIADANVFVNAKFDLPYAVAFTFDDGASSDLVNANYLKARGLSGMFFVSTARIGTPGFLTQKQIIEIRQMGMLIGSHSHEHRMLNHMPLEEARRQMATSKTVLEDLLGEEVDHIAFPGGGHNSNVVAISHEVGFKYVFTTAWGANQLLHSGPAVLRREMIVRGMTQKQFLDLVTGRDEFFRMSVYWCKQVARGFLPKSVYKTIRKGYIDM